MARNTSVEIGDELGTFIDSQIRTGRYNSASEVVRAGLRHLQDEETKMAALRVAVLEGIQSGPAQSFDFEAFVASRKNKRT